jgi:glycosyltransferase involved in cell wall biosynthesis
MRILHIDTGVMMRGGQTQLMMLVRGMRDKGHQQTIACPPSSALAKAASEEGFEILAIPRRYWRACQTIRQFLKAHPHDIVSAHDSRAQTISYFATVGRPIVRVANRLVAFEPRNRFVHRVKYSRTCDVVVASSQAVKDTMVRNGVRPDHIKVIRGGIDFPEQLEDHEEARARMRAKWKLHAGDFVIGHLAAFTSEKGQLDALYALIALLPKHPNLRMILAGDGPLREDPQTRAQSRLTHGAALLPGYIKPDAEFYAGLDLFLANSTSEALGLAPLYAMAHEVPVIASNVGGLPEVVGEGGWLIPPSDTAALALAIEQALADPIQLRELGRHARQHARGFSADGTIDQTEALYHQLLNN